MSAADPGLFAAIRRLAGIAAGMAQSRLELASLELGESGRRFVGSLLIGFLGGLALASAVLTASAWLVVVLWPQFGAVTLLAIAVVYALLGWGLLAALRRRLREEPPLLQATVAELQRDAALLRGDPPN